MAESQRFSTDAVGPETVESLCARLRAPLLRYFVRRGYRVDEAEDCVQESFLRIAKADVGRLENAEAYLFTVASSVAIDQARKFRSRYRADHEPLNKFDLESKDVSPARVLEDREDLVRLDRILRELRPRTREIFLLNRLEGLTYTQLAARFGISVAGIEKQMSKALAHLRKRYFTDDE